VLPEFIDTNILVYAYDTSDRLRHTAAKNLIATLVRQDAATTSVQVLQEFYATATRQIASPMTPADALGAVRAFSRWKVFSPLAGDVAEAIAISVTHQTSFWDAMVILAAKKTGCQVVWSADLTAGQTIEGVTVHNPFAA
jgi:predicted nucleic acid-binding protein